MFPFHHYQFQGRPNRPRIRLAWRRGVCNTHGKPLGALEKKLECCVLERQSQSLPQQSTWVTPATGGQFWILSHWLGGQEITQQSAGVGLPHNIYIQYIYAVPHHNILCQKFHFALPPPLPTSNKLLLFHREHTIVGFQELMIYVKQARACH